MATTAELKARLSLDTSLFTRGISAAHSAAAGLQSSFTSISGVGISLFAKLAAAAAALGGAAGFVLATKNAFELGKAVTEMSDRTGIGIKSVVELEQVFKDAGLEAADLGLAINKMQKFISQQGEKGKLGEEFQRIKNLAPEEQFLAIAESIRAIEDPAKRAQIAMEIFGRGGGKILPVIMDPKLLDEAIKALGPQARLLEQNASTFQRVAIQLDHAGVVLRGFFVGVAAGIAKPLSDALDKMISTVDFTSFGIKFGESLVKGAQMLVGFLNQPALFVDSITAAFQAAVLGLGNMLIAAFNAGIQFFKTGMISAITGIGGIITSTLLKAFATPIAYLQAAIIETFSPSAATTADIQKNIRQAQEGLSEAQTSAAQHKPGSGATVTHNTIFGPQIESLENARLYEQDLKDIETYTNRVKEAQEQLNSAIQDSRSSIQRTAEELMGGGGPKFGLGEGQTADQIQQEGQDQLKAAMDSMAQAIKDFSVKDVTGAGDAMKKAADAAAKAIEAGGKVIANAMGQAAGGMGGGGGITGPTDGSDSWRMTGGYTPKYMGPPTAPFQPPMGSPMTLPGNALNQPSSSAYLPGGEPLFRPGSALTAADREAIMDQYVAQGGERPTSSPEAYHAVKAGDVQRRQETQRQSELQEARGKLGLETTNDLLKGIKTNTDNLK